MLQLPDGKCLFEALDLDASCLAGYTEFIFQNDPLAEVVLTLDEFMATLLRLQRSTPATVYDLMKLHKTLADRITALDKKIECCMSAAQSMQRSLS